MPNINNIFPSKYLKAADFTSGPQNAVMGSLAMEVLTEGHDAQPVLYFHGQTKGLVLNKTNANMIAHTLGPETDAWMGKTLQLYVEPVSFQGRIVDAIRVRMAPEVAAPQAAPAVPSPPAPRQAPPAPREPGMDDDLTDIPW